MSSTRTRHVKSMSASGHPMKSCLPPIDDTAEYQRSALTCAAVTSLFTSPRRSETAKPVYMLTPSPPAPSSPQQPPSSPSAFSITSSSTTTPDRTRFPRGSSSRSTFHGAQLRDRRPATYNGPPDSPSLSQHGASSLASPRRGTSTSLIGKITSKFGRRSVRAQESE